MKVVAVIAYEKIHRIGVGQGMHSEVFLVHDPQLGGRIVVKEVPLSNFGNSVPEYFAEASALFASEHPHVVRVLYACQTQSHVCIAMPHYPQGSLADVLAVRMPSVKELLKIVQDVLAGLTNVHLAKHVHLDVKPSNIFIDATGKCLLADFGQARTIDPRGVAKPKGIYGPFIPPEAYLRLGVTSAADIYQVGVLLYRALAGEALWSHQEQLPSLAEHIKAGTFPDRRMFLPHIPSRLRRAIKKALEVDPQDRFQSASEMADELGQVDVKLDWHCSGTWNGELTWRADRSPQPELVVELKQSGPNWTLQIFSEGTGGRRARDKSSWVSDASRDVVIKAARQVLKSLH